jgi:hypothetical protein
LLVNTIGSEINRERKAKEFRFKKSFPNTHLFYDNSFQFHKHVHRKKKPTRRELDNKLTARQRKRHTPPVGSRMKFVGDNSFQDHKRVHRKKKPTGRELDNKLTARQRKRHTPPVGSRMKFVGDNSFQDHKRVHRKKKPTGRELDNKLTARQGSGNL